jgi:hypothetical protein
MEWIDIEVLNVFIKIGTIGLIVGVISVLLTESIKITYLTVFSKEYATRNRFSWWVNLVTVLGIAHISTFIYEVETNGQIIISAYIIQAEITVIFGWILSTLFYRIILKVVFTASEILIINSKTRRLEAQCDMIDLAALVHKNEIALKESMKNELLIEAGQALEVR